MTMAEEIIDATKDMTLEDIGKRDLDNYNLVWKTCRGYRFNNIREASMFQGATLHKCLMKFNVNLDATVRQIMSPLFHRRTDVAVVGDKIDQQLLLHGVRVERRTYKEPEFAIRSGFYVYYKNEIAYFISEPFETQTLKVKPEESKGEKVVDIRKLSSLKADGMIVFTNFKF